MIKSQLNNRSDKSPKYKTLTDLARILSLFRNTQTEEKSITEISKLLGMHPSKVSRMIGALQDDGYFEKNLKTGKYRLGIAFFELGMISASNFPLRKIVRPHIEQMAKETSLMVSWGILNNFKVVIIDRIQNLNIDLFTYTMGLNAPIHSTSVGNVLLSFASEEEQDEILRSIDLTAFTSRTIVDPNLLREHLKEVRKRGYATDDGGTYEELCSIAAPIRTRSGKVIAAIGLTAEKSLKPAEELFQLADYLKEKALFISRQIGFGSDIL